ncbi:thioredoxin family protein [Bacillus sp. DTU_2020_1000418_1_SI_GHA_SEK_038]|uniref:thioredoxin family protein n=1 Tax=Bacillus sp. DTU_2020_1000418_1_SI_GHA_SEK_038 TaxID=3077585 RepID=UPI0028EE96AE|nr:thioredoxin family protein [Bacillus sp. DTU_2020_1000418_1_SI_GHA_SEK_038]WNS74863.1 thioredoxin family protein [Bacillus sp. DTU_2020_1000418_1_SI_GHA_SEK_038]
MQELSREEIEQLFNKNKSGFLYLYTPLCGTCQLASKMLSVIEELMPEQPIGKADLNYLSAFSEVLGIESVPCLIIVKDGNIQEKIYAFHSVPYLLDKMKSFL